MAKRKIKQNRKHVIKKTKSSLPELDDDNLVATLCLKDSTAENEFNTSLNSASYLLNDELDQRKYGDGCGKSDDDTDLPEGLLSAPGREEKLSNGDIVWIRNTVSSCFWPGYVKNISKNKAYILFINYRKFSTGEKSFSYNIKSKKLMRFHTNDYQKILEQGVEHCKENDRKKGITEGGEMNAFLNAVDLAETYVEQRASGTLTNRHEVYEYFNTNGLSLSYKQCVEEHQANMYSRLPTPPHANESTDINTSMSSVTSDKHTRLPQNAEAENVISDVNVRSSLTIQTNETPVEIQAISSVFPLYHSTAHSEAPPDNSRKTKTRKNALDLFNKRNITVVKYILDGNCDNYLLSLFNETVPSRRMNALNEKWRLDINRSKRREFENKYFEDNQQLETVCTYLRNFIKESLCEVNSLLKRGDLLFDVFLPEAIIYSLHKVRRRDLKSAEKIYKEGCRIEYKTPDAILTKPLTDEERVIMNQKVKEYKEELNLSFL